ncbi:MAG TPA: hypothetical protein VLH75_04725 [Longimicrobiales bacterium]|nr:hypothetical protein [Longimicrobiales bacterium]
MKRSPGVAEGKERSFDALAIWATLASFGIVIGFLALARNFERGGAGRRWRRADATGAEVDALLAADELEEAG